MRAMHHTPFTHLPNTHLCLNGSWLHEALLSDGGHDVFWETCLLKVAHWLGSIATNH